MNDATTKLTYLVGAKRLQEKNRDTEYLLSQEQLERFAALVLSNNPPKSSMAWQEGFEAGRVAEHERIEHAAIGSVKAAILYEREACAKVCDDWAKTSYLSEAKSCARIIRARGNT